MRRTITPGQLVYWKNEPGIVIELKGMSELIIRLNETKRCEVAHISEVTTGPIGVDDHARSHLLTSDKEWDNALERFKIIEPLLNGNREPGDVERVAKASKKGVATIYRWLKRYGETGLVSSLTRPPRKDKGHVQLEPEVEEIVQRVINEEYLNKQRKNVAKTYRAVKEACYELDIDPPHKNTIYLRIRQLNQKNPALVERSRISPASAKQKFQALRGSFPGGVTPNEIHQIDHTPVDLIIVDEEHRLPIGRPYLTMCIDVATKMIGGFYMSLDPVSASTAGLCISQAVLPKEDWLAKRGIEAEWPMQGKMVKLHMDNAKEFRGSMLKRACAEHGIIHEWRPNGQPNYGPHVERAFRTFMEEFHSIPGSTFSNLAQRKHYDAEGHACMTLREAEDWFGFFVTYCYHHQGHRGNGGIPPIKMYHKLVYGDDKTPGVGLPAPISNPRKFRLDFTPYVSRSVQRDGITIDHVSYFSSALRCWVGAKDPNNPKEARKFIVARDPRDISVVYFLNPETEQYEEIPYRDNRHPPISHWELREVLKRISADHSLQPDEEMIFKGIKKMREHEAQAIEKTRLARQSRASEKRALRNKEKRKTSWQGVHKVPAKPAFQDATNSADDDIIEPFDEVIVRSHE